MVINAVLRMVTLGSVTAEKTLPLEMFSEIYLNNTTSSILPEDTKHDSGRHQAGHEHPRSVWGQKRWLCWKLGTKSTAN